jgi:hypothetical protein
MTAFDVTDPRGRVLHNRIIQALMTAVEVMQPSVLAMPSQHHILSFYALSMAIVLYKHRIDPL